MSDTILKVENVTKRFGGIKALDRISLEIERGEIHSVCGENGAGKSTLMNVISGVFSSDEYEGDVFFEGEKVNFDSVLESQKEGIVIIHQELALIPEMSIMDNIFLGNELLDKYKIDERLTYERAQELLNVVGLDKSPLLPVKNLSVGEQQLVEIAKAFSKDVKLLILDEPTAALNELESENLLILIEGFKKKGITSILISHKLNEVISISDRVTVIRDGKNVTLLDEINDRTEDIIIKNMVGRELGGRFPKRSDDVKDEIVLELKNWTVEDPKIKNRKALNNINLNVKKGEIVGVAGLMGAGRTELALSVFGKQYGKFESGEIYVNGKEREINTTKEAIDNGLAYLTEDRKDRGLISMSSIANNITIANLEDISDKKILDFEKEYSVSKKYISDVKIVCSSQEQSVESLSGGNQQKVLLSRWLYSDPDVLILDEPTRGIDVGSKYEIYEIINNLTKQGMGVLMISSELPELIGICDRIYVMREGTITGEVQGSVATEEQLMKYMVREGIDNEKA